MAAHFGYDDVGTHASMLVDPIRMRAFAEAIKRSVRPDDVVVDVGAGSGVLALLAAKAGARHVYAIERGPMAKLIELAAEKNGFADIVRVIRGDAREVQLEEQPTLIISEMIGSFGLDEDYLGLLGAVQAQSAPGCRVLPSSIEMQLSLATLPGMANEVETVRSGLGVNLDDLGTLLLSRVALAWVSGDSMIATATTPERFKIGDRPPKVIGGTVQVQRAADAHAIIGWFNSELFEGTTLTSNPNADKTHWANIVFPLDEPMRVEVGDTVELEVRPRLLTDRGTWSWRVKRGSDLRKGDAMKSIVGDRDDLMKQLGLRARSLDPHDAELLPIWSAALTGGVDTTEVLVRRLRAAFPKRYADDDDATSEVMRLVRLATPP